MSEKKRILFVDDDRYVLDGLRRMLYVRRHEWKMEFVTGPADAFKVMRSTHYDMVISDLKMPDMDGVEFLEKVREKYPDMIRFMLSGYADQPLCSRAARCVHQLIPKPCDAERLAHLISGAIALHERIKSNKTAKVISDVRSLPVMPKVYQRVIDQLKSPECSPKEIGRLIAKDIGMSTKILHVANSGFYGPIAEIADPVRAVVFLGLKAVEALLLTSGIFSKLSEDTVRRFCVDGLQDHCSRVGMLARMICEEKMMSGEELEIATMAGILHDTGKMIHIASYPDPYQEAIRESRRGEKCLFDLEQEMIHVPHTDLGGCLLELWGLPNTIIEAAAYHHDPEQCTEGDFTINTAVYAANILDHQLYCSPGDGRHEEVDLSFFENLGLGRFIMKHKPMLVKEHLSRHEYAC